MFFSEWGLSFDRIIWQIISFLWKSRDFRFFCLNFTELIFYLISSSYLRSSLVKSFDILYLQTLFECFNRNFSSIASTKQHKKIFRVYLFCQDFRVFSLRCLVVKSKPESFSFLFSWTNVEHFCGYTEMKNVPETFLSKDGVEIFSKGISILVDLNEGNIFPEVCFRLSNLNSFGVIKNKRSNNSLE